jgi:hypothetical protein
VTLQLAGFAVDDEQVLELVELLRDAGYEQTAERLKWAVRYGDELVGLRIADRLAILDVLDVLGGDVPEGLTALRGVLTSEHRWRVRHGLV